MTQSSTHSASFFRQSAWMVTATVASGVFMMAVHIAVQGKMLRSEWNVFAVLLKFFLIMGIPAAGLQIVFAHQAAAAVTEEERKGLAGAVRAVAGGTFVLWLAMALAVAFLQDEMIARLKITHPWALWATLLLALISLWAPLLRGILQGGQNFLGLGNMLIVDGAGRFLAIVVIAFLGGQAAGGMTGALLGQCVALLLGAWLARDILRSPGQDFRWKPWLQKAVPLTCGSGVILFMSNADAIFVQALLSEAQASLYIPATVVGTGLVTATMPMVSVMFPKIVQGLARTERSNAFQLAFWATAALAGAGALACTLLPELPLRIIFMRDSSRWAAAPLVPWVAWSLLPLILANLLIGNLLAHRQFAVAIWAVVVPCGYTLTLVLFRHKLYALDPIAGGRAILMTLGGFNLVLLGIAYWFTLKSIQAGRRGGTANGRE